MLDPSILNNGEEQFEHYVSRIIKVHYIQYDYRHTDGELFSCIAHNIEEARKKKSEWIAKREA